MNSINYCLESAGISGKDLDAVIIGSNFLTPTPWITKNYSSFSIRDHIRAQREYWNPKLNGQKQVNWLEVFKEKVNFDAYPGGWKDILSKNNDHHGKNIWNKVKEKIYSGIENHLKINRKLSSMLNIINVMQLMHIGQVLLEKRIV